MAIKLDSETIKLITLFETLTGAPVKDCIVVDDTVYMVIEEGKIGLAIGKDGKNVNTVEKIVGKKIKLFEYSPDVCKFAKRIIPHINQINLANNTLEIRVEKKYRPIIIGRERKNLNLLKKIFERNFDIKELVIR